MTLAVQPSRPLLGLRPSLEQLDRALAMLFGLSLMVLFASPSRFLYTPVPYDGQYVSFIPPNLIDLTWIATGGVLFVRAGRFSGRVLLALAVLILIGIVALRETQGLTYEKVADLLLFNLRLFGGLAVGWVLSRGVMSASRFGTFLLAGTVIVAISTVVLFRGVVSYDLYSNDRRFGGMGLGSNEAGMLFAAAFNLLPGLFRRVRWSALAAPLLITAILFTGSRTAFLLAIPGVFLWIPVLRRTFSGRRAVIAWAVFLIMSTIIFWLEFQLSLGFVQSGSVAPVLSRLSVTDDASTVGRLELYGRVPLYLWNNPVTAVIGAGGSNVAVEAFLQDALSIWTYHTHNLLLQFLVAYGLTGALLLTAIAWPQFRSPSRFPDDAARGLRWFALTLTAGQALQYGLIEEKFLLIYAMVAGYVAAASARPPRRETP